ncbi:uncharacterized protein TrAtP1_008121 [Trichoderma atroviride]|uniref:uncharacterized protein n=1 Tax=Hypocrea atroviridis TaxID=63577 RepID=UPI00332043BA|nr:hypothetical protein TrAtP1_008121 [Trichoderma atroviride]
MFADIQTKTVNEKVTAHEVPESGEDTSLKKGANTLAFFEVLPIQALSRYPTAKFAVL